MAREKGSLVVQSDNSKLRALLRVLPAILILLAVGIAVLVVCMKLCSGELAEFIDGALAGSKFANKVSAAKLFVAAGIAGFAVPFLFIVCIVISALKEASCSYIDVYENAVYGRFMVPDDRGVTYCNAFISYDKIIDVDSRGKKVYVWTKSAGLEAIAFNAKEVRNEIERRADFSMYNKVRKPASKKGAKGAINTVKKSIQTTARRTTKKI